MARVSGASDMARHSLGGPVPSPIDAASAELSQLLRRLQETVLHPTPEREKLLRKSEFERERLAMNIEYARSSLAQLEADANSGKSAARKLQAHGTLAAQRDVLELLLDRLQDLRQIAENEQDDDDDVSGDEDILGDILPAPREVPEQQPTREPEAVPEEPSIPERVAEQEAPVAATQPTATETATPTQTTTPSTQTTQTLRGRRTADTQSNTNQSQASGHTTARAALFANRRKPAPPETSTATAEAILDNQRAEQDALSGAILKMAGALKASSHKFSDTLEADKEVLGRAGEGIEKTEQSMEAARGRMGTLRKMTEGKGWWGRVILYAWVYGLMLSLVLLVFVFPKLRF